MRVVTVNQCGEIQRYLLLDGALCPLNEALPVIFETSMQPILDLLMTERPWYRNLKNQNLS